MNTDRSRRAPPAGGPLPTRHIAAATVGNALEFYDFLTYAFFSIQIGHAFFPAQSAYSSLMLSLATFGAGFATRPLGAFLIGNYSDRAGRRPAMVLCFLLMGTAIVGMALTPSYATIGLAAPILAVIFRMLQGFSLGGEIGATTAFLMESAPPEKRGLIVSLQGASQNIALLAGGLVGISLTALLPPAALEQWGWRIAFLLGAAVVPFGLWLRSNLAATAHARPAAGAAPPLRRLRLAYEHRRVLLLGFLVIASGTIANYLFSYTVTYAQSALQMPARSGFLAQAWGNALGIPATLLGGWLSDRYGRRLVTISMNALFLVLIYPCFAWITATRSDLALIASIALLTAVTSLIYGPVYAGLTEGLPEAIRGAGFGLIYSAAVAIFGGTTQLTVAWLIHVTGSPMASAWYMIGAALLGQIALVLRAETAPVRLGAPGTLAGRAGA